jgi:opacity protein-like surface antigen
VHDYERFGPRNAREPPAGAVQSPPMRPTHPLFFLAALLAVASPAAAQSNSDPGLGVGLDAGYARGPDAESGSLTGGTHARLRLTGGIGIELSAGYRRDSFTSNGTRVLSVDEIPVEASVLVFPFPNGRVQPYVLAGIGFTWAKPRGEGSNAGASYGAESLFALHGGAGVDVRTGFSTSVFLDARFIFLQVDAVQALPNQPSANYVRVAAGLNVYF